MQIKTNNLCHPLIGTLCLFCLFSLIVDKCLSGCMGGRAFIASHPRVSVVGVVPSASLTVTVFLSHLILLLFYGFVVYFFNNY